MQRSTSIGTGAAVAGILVANRSARTHPGMPSRGADSVNGLGLCAGYLVQSIDCMKTLIQRNGEVLRRSLSIAAGVVAAGVFTHGMVRSAMNLADRLPISTYLGFFQHIVFATERLWSRAQGLKSMTGDIYAFAGFYARMVHLLCPSIGFVLFWILSRHHVGRNAWKPLAIGLILSLTPLASVTYISREWSEVIRTVMIVLLMVWSVGAIRISKPHIPTAAS
jgi:hypothetical protein